MDTSQAITLILLFATLVQFCVEIIKKIVGERIMAYIPAPVWSLLFGVIFAFTFRLDAFSILGYAAQYPLVSTAVTGLILSAGAAPIHEFVEKIRSSRIDK